MKTISILIPTYNEEDNVELIAAAVTEEFNKNLPGYNYEIVFIDNYSEDGTRQKIRTLCAQNSKIKAIFNAKNFGFSNSQVYGLMHTTGDATILLYADFQEPIEMIPNFVKKWEEGYKIVCGIKTASEENKFMYWMRTLYYKIIKRISNVEQIEHFTGFALYDKSFLKLLSSLKDSAPFLRGIVAEIGYGRIDLPYTQNQRMKGKSSFNFYRLYDLAMLSITSYTKVGLRLATLAGFLIAFSSIIVAIITFIRKIFLWDSLPIGVAAMNIGIFLLGAIQLIFIGLIGEYILTMNSRIMGRPLVIEMERLNFDFEDGSK